MSKIHFIKHHLINIWLNLIIHQSLPYYFRAMCRLWHQDKTAALVSVYSEVFEVLTLRSHWMKQELLGSNRRPRERHHQQLLLCLKYKSPDAYSFLEFFSIQDALFDTARLLKFHIFCPARMSNMYSLFIFFTEF